MTGRCPSFAGIVACLVMVILLVGVSVCPGDEVTGGISNIAFNQKDKFAADGWWETIDTANDGVGNSVYFVTPDPLYWVFGIRHLTWAPHWSENGAVGVRVAMMGVHCQGPHEDDAIDNLLPEIVTKLGRNIMWPPGAGWRFTKEGLADHDCPPDTHRDSYKFEAKVMAFQPEPPDTSNKLGGHWWIEAEHRAAPPAPPQAPMDMGFGSGMSSGTSVCFDAGTGALSLALTGIDILDAMGGLSGGIDPAYTGDPFLDGLITTTEMSYLGQDPDGRYRFSGCEISVTDPIGNFYFDVGFQEYLIKTTVIGTATSSFAHVDSLDIVDLYDPVEGASPFLGEFADLDVMKQGYSESESENINGVMLTFYTETDLAQATNGFTESATLPATVIISSSQGLVSTPAFSSHGVMLLALLLAAAVVSLTVRRARRAANA